VRPYRPWAAPWSRGRPSRRSAGSGPASWGPKGVRVVWLRTTGLPETIPDTGDAVADFGTGFGAGMTGADIIAGMQEETMLDRLPTLAELGNAAAFLASDRASGMTATLANVTCGAFLD
jgi:3-oxoacyl-[acyl-carrier protein] reductase